MARAPDAALFERLYRSCYDDLLRYALRRTGRPETAADVVADTFLVAWRRFGDIPAGKSRPWLFGVARNVLANQYRAERRDTDLAARLRHELSGAIVTAPEVPAEVPAAFATLSATDQELLRLVAWEGLSTEELAVALGCSANAARIRLHRARARFAAALRAPSFTK
ncbi:RNA polymerase subunit sigma-24 [Actinoplanes sp. ATCC 53533]|uniref:RNA polymerase sigma factor n=1 Tax=Actinoplanes sp. ATCC 53533 TaxID=1288362 RepID=UPI000F7933E7|nr:sigma-70 family RNA polymerase sigma factor [Actinoplanes sp. ATCC 53533]RSM73093.1 RNA polymerase subunit sigma-24 [Actinoplanes sp. ATCC 53533]